MSLAPAASSEGLPASAKDAADAIPAYSEDATDELPATREAGAGALSTTAGEPDADALPTAVGEAGDDRGGVDQSEEAARAEYRRIAERRVRLGLLLADIGRNNNITVTPDEVNQAITREARRHPGHERQILDFYRQNPGTIDTLRAPIFEDKVIDFIVELAKIGERKVTSQELLGEPDPEDDASQS